MADDGQGADVSIATFLISKSDGQKFKDQIQKTRSDDKKSKWKDMVIIQAEINMMTKTMKPLRVDLWYSSAAELEQSGIKFMDYARMQDVFGDLVVFQPRTMVHSCLDCTVAEKEKSCIKDGKYCPILPNDLKHKETTEGDKQEAKDIPRQLVEQSIREQCMFENIDNSNKSRWFKYMYLLTFQCIKAEPYHVFAGGIYPITKECDSNTINNLISG